MRLWHKDLIPYLPRQQLVAQWRECCAIASSIAKKGTPNHLLVNKVLEYHFNQFYEYTHCVWKELTKRGYRVSKQSMVNFNSNLFDGCNYFNNEKNNVYSIKEVFEDWHNKRYLKQCLFNLQEKFDCGGISSNEWELIMNRFYKDLA